MVMDGQILSEVCSRLVADVTYRSGVCGKRTETWVQSLVNSSGNVKEPVGTFNASLHYRHVYHPTVKCMATTNTCKKIIESSRNLRKNSRNEKGARRGALSFMEQPCEL